MFLTTVHRMKQLAQEWERLLYSTGGAFDLLKSFWFAMSWKWKGGTAHLETISQRPGDLTMTCGSDPTQIEHWACSCLHQITWKKHISF
jgi:hypothetical protein